MKNDERDYKGTLNETGGHYVGILEEIVAEGGEDARFLGAVLELVKTNEILKDDVLESQALFEFSTDEFAARTIVRTMAAQYEARLYLLQQLLIQLQTLGEFSLSESDLILLKGKRPKTSSNGKVSETEKYLNFLDNLCSTARIWSQIYTRQIPPGTAHPNWIHVQAFVKIRNRLMHPKRQADLHVSDTEIESLNRAIDWFNEYFECFFGKAA
jgi:hypothetical protein